MLEIENVDIVLAKQRIIKDLSMQLANKQIGCILGPSGCGKTTLLRAIAGFTPIQQGRIVNKNELLSSHGYSKAVAKRKIGIVFQDYALFPHLNVYENIVFGLRHLSAVDQQARAIQLLELISLANKAQAYPHELSGGQQQRVALARALAPKPDLLLLDEPFSALDPDLRDSMVEQVRHILQTEEVTSLMVTHDQREAFAMADQIAVIRDGELQQLASPYDLYHEPKNAFVAQFIGEGTLVPVTAQSTHQLLTIFGPIERNIDLLPGSTYQLLIRPDDISIDPQGELAAQVTRRQFRGSHIYYQLMMPEAPTHVFYALVPSHYSFQVGELMPISLELDHMILFPA